LKSLLRDVYKAKGLLNWNTFKNIDLII
jgi:hypothetical protein